MSFSISINEKNSGVRIDAAGTTLTRLLSQADGEERNFLLAPPHLLAVWLAANWWRLRWEARPKQFSGQADRATWNAAHILTEVSGGYSWPRASFWGLDSQVAYAMDEDPVGVAGPVRFLSQIPESAMPAAEFESGVETFWKAVLDTSDQGAELKGILDQLTAERTDPEQTAWRRLEAKLGFDPDQVPDSTMLAFAEHSKCYAEADVEEAAAASPGAESASILQQMIEATAQHGAECKFLLLQDWPPATAALQAAPPWSLAEDLASAMRWHAGVSGVLENSKLSEMTGITGEGIESGSGAQIPYAIWVQSGQDQQISLRKRYPASRRFEIARALGDFTYAKSANAQGRRLGPIAESITERQQFNRAFAAALLCPYSELDAFLPTDEVERDDVDAAAQYFQVSPYAVASVLVNHHRIDHGRFEQLTAAA